MSKQFIRSPSYPSLPLDAAVELVGRIDQRYRSAAVDRADAAKLIGFSSLSGAANKALAALAAYGLLERAGKGDTRVTERARAILHPGTPDEKKENLEAAALAPPLFQKLRERYPEMAVPPEDGVVTYLNRQNFNPNAIRLAARAFLRTVEYLEEFGPISSRLGELGEGLEHAESEGEEEISDPTPRALPAERSALDEFEWLRTQVGRSVTVRLMATGEVGPTEIERLIRVLETQRDVLAEDDRSGPEMR